MYLYIAFECFPHVFLNYKPFNKLMCLVSSMYSLTDHLSSQFSDMLLHTKPSGTGTFEFKDEMPIFGMRVNLLLLHEIKKIICHIPR